MKESDDSKNIFLEDPVCRMQLITYERQWTGHLASGDLGSLDKKCVILFLFSKFQFGVQFLMSIKAKERPRQ